MGKLSKMPLAEQWAERICQQHRKSVESVIDTGRELMAAKANLVHGEWERMFSDGLLPFTIRTAQRLMAVAEHPVIGNTTHGSLLPQSWRTLYELTKVPEPTLKNAIRDGVITPDMPRSAVAGLLPERPRREAVQAASDPPEPEDYEERFDERSSVLIVINAIRNAVANWPLHVSLNPLVEQLRHEADRLEQRMEKHAS